MELYDFTEWSDRRLQERLGDLLDSEQIPHREERYIAIRRELAHIGFELSQRTPEPLELWIPR